MKKVALITGVTGQDGSYLAELLIQKGYEVHGLIRRISTGPNTVNIDHIKDKIHLHYSDMSDGSNLRNLVLSIKPDEVYNLAAQSQVGVSFETPEFTAEVNAIGVLNILEAIRTLKSEKQCKFYQASTSELYGKVVETPQTEKTPFYPRSPYAVAKLYAYWITVNYRESYGLFTCNGILFNHESPRRGPEFVTRKIVQGMIRTYLGKQKYLELGNLDARRDWGHAKDYVNAMWLMMQKEIPEDYVISSGEEHSVRDFCESVANYLDINIKWVGGGLDEVGMNAKTGEVIIKINKDLYRPAEVATLFGDCSKAKKLLNWKPVYNFNALVHEMCEKEMEMQTLTHNDNTIKSQPVNDLPKVLEFGSYYVSDFLDADKTTRRSKYSLDLYLDTDLGAVRLNKKDLAPASSMWGKYWYRSGTNATMTNELKGIVNEICSRVKLKDDDIWLDIACNDGTLMKFIPDNIKKVGIDPCNDSFYAESSKHGEVIQDYFSEKAWKKTSVADKKAKVITCIAMFYDLDNPHSFVDDLARVLDEDGLLVLQMSYTPLMVKQMAFDNICHEHVYYYDLTSIQNLFFRHGFKIVDCSINDTNGGSFRVYLQKTFSQLSSFGSAPLRDVCDMRIDSILNYEKNELNIRDIRVWEEFGKELRILQKTIVDFVNDAVAKGKTVYGYGASTKGNTLLQHFGLDHTKIKAIAERSPYKFGMKTVGTEIPIISEDEMRKAKPDYLLVLPWHFIDEFERREQDYINSGGALVVPCPKFKIISK